MAFSTGHDLYGYRQKYADQSLNQLKATGANYVHISAYATMPGINALTSKPVTDVASVRYIIRKVRRKGMKVFFKPVIEINRKWRGFVSDTIALTSTILKRRSLNVVRVTISSATINLPISGFFHACTLSRVDSGLPCMVQYGLQTIYFEVG